MKKKINGKEENEIELDDQGQPIAPASAKNVKLANTVNDQEPADGGTVKPDEKDDTKDKLGGDKSGLLTNKPKNVKGSVVYGGQDSMTAHEKLNKLVELSTKAAEKYATLNSVAATDTLVPLADLKGEKFARKSHIAWGWARLFLADWQQPTNIPVPELQVGTVFEEIFPESFPLYMKDAVMELLLKKILLYQDVDKVIRDAQVVDTLDSSLANSSFTEAQKKTVLATIKKNMETVLPDVQKRQVAPDFSQIALASVNTDAFDNPEDISITNRDIRTVVEHTRNVHTLLSASATDNATIAVMDFPAVARLFARWFERRTVGSKQIQVQGLAVINMYMSQMGLTPLFSVKFEKQSFFMADMVLDDSFLSMGVGDLVYMWNQILEIWYGNFVISNSPDQAWKLRSFGIMEPPKIVTVRIDETRKKVLDDLVTRLTMYCAIRSMVYGDEQGAVVNHLTTLYENNARVRKGSDMAALTTLPLLKGCAISIDALSVALGTIYDILFADDLYHPNIAGLTFVRNSMSKFLKQIQGLEPDSPQIRNPLGMLQPGSISTLPVILNRAGLPQASNVDTFYQMPQVNITSPKFKGRTFNTGAGPIAFFRPEDDQRTDLGALLSPEARIFTTPYQVLQGIKIETQIQIPPDLQAVVQLATKYDANHPLSPTFLQDCDATQLQSRRSIINFVNEHGNNFITSNNIDLFKNILVLDYSKSKDKMLQRSTGWSSVMFRVQNVQKVYMSIPNWFYNVFETGIRGREIEKVTWPYLAVRHEEQNWDISEEVQQLASLTKTFVAARFKEFVQDLGLDLDLEGIRQQIGVKGNLADSLDKSGPDKEDEEEGGSDE